MRFRQWISPTYKNLYDFCLSQTPFHRNEVLIETRSDHNYCRPWIDDPTISTALPRVQLFFDTDSIHDSIINIDDHQKPNNDHIRKINWTPTIHTTIPETFECPQQSEEELTHEQEIFVRHISQFIDETRITALCCELNLCNVIYWRLSIHRIVSRLSSFLTRHLNYENLLGWLHEYVCRTFDRIFIGHYVDLFQILYHEYPHIRSLFIDKATKTWPTNDLCLYVYNKLLQKPNDLTEEVIYSIALPPLPMPTVCLLIPGLAYGSHMQRIEFWQRNLAQVTIVTLAKAIEQDNQSEQSQIQSVYEDIIKKFNEIRQLYPNHHVMFLSWNVGCILALKAALVCSVSSIICLSLPFVALSEESKNDFTRINASILFITGEKQYTNQIDRYRRRLKLRNGLIELGQCNEKLFMSEDGKYRFRLTQQLIDKLIIEEILDFITILSSKVHRTSLEEVDEENRKRRYEIISSATLSHIEASSDPFLYMGINYNNNTISTTLTIPPEQDPNSIILKLNLPSSTSTRKRKGSNLMNALENDHSSINDSFKPKHIKRGRHRTKNLLPSDDLESAPNNKKCPMKITTKKQNKQITPPTPTPTPTPTTSILNTLLQLPSHQPKQRTNETNLIKSVHQPLSFVDNLLSSNRFH